jgi:hypothetical protein
MFLGAALLAPCGSALAETPRPAEARWGIRPEKSAPALVDFARWLSRRLGGVFGSAEVELAPVPDPVANPIPDPTPDPTPDAVCPERVHCPIG